MAKETISIEWMQGKLSAFKGKFTPNELFTIHALGVPRNLTRSDGTEATLTPIKCIPADLKVQESCKQTNGSYLFPVFSTYDENLRAGITGRVTMEKNSRDRDSIVFNATEIEALEREKK